MTRISMASAAGVMTRWFLKVLLQRDVALCQYMDTKALPPIYNRQILECIWEWEQAMMTAALFALTGWAAAHA
jgi:hypothetical protein